MNALVKITRFFMAIGLLLITAATAIIILPISLISKGIRLLLIIMLCSLAFTSCKKDQDTAPKNQIVKYHVECEYCLIYVEDNVWNHLNELERSKNQHFNVNGMWDYSFTNTVLDSLYIRFYISPLGSQQTVKATIITNDNRKLIINEKMGGEYDNEKSFMLALKD